MKSILESALADAIAYRDDAPHTEQGQAMLDQYRAAADRLPAGLALLDELSAFAPLVGEALREYAQQSPGNAADAVRLSNLIDDYADGGRR